MGNDAADCANFGGVGGIFHAERCCCWSTSLRLNGTIVLRNTILRLSAGINFRPPSRLDKTFRRCKFRFFTVDFAVDLSVELLELDFLFSL